MNQIAASNTDKAVFSIARNVFTVKNFAAKNRQQGAWPGSESAIWALRAGAPKNGFGDAFLTVNRRVLVDEQKFWGAVTHLQGVKSASNK
jgi:hypothetical protein